MKKMVKQVEESDKVFVKVSRACGPDGLNERWAGCETAPTLNVFDNMGDVRAVVLIRERKKTNCYDNSTRARNPADCGDCSPTLQAHLGTGGGNIPLVIKSKKKRFCYGMKVGQSKKSQKPWSEGIAQCISAGCHDASVIMIDR